MTLPLIPRPQTLEELDGHLPLITSYDLHAIADAARDWAPGAAYRLDQFADELAHTEQDIAYVDDDAEEAEIEEELPDFAMTIAKKPHIEPEGFTLALTPGELVIEASDANGALYAVNALIQALRAPQAVPFRASSAPQYEVRGCHFDIVRHFFGVDTIKQVIDIASAYNLNRLHLHLTDDQGWRIEIEGRPELTRTAAQNECDGGPGGYLTHADYEEIQDYAALFGMEVVPEIDLPGHTTALMVAYPHISPTGEAPEPYTGKDAGFSWINLTHEDTWEILDDVVTSIAKHTHSEFLHIGGDEVLQVGRPEYEKFIERLCALVVQKGKTVAAWHEAAGSDLPSGTQLQFWTDRFNAENTKKAASNPTLRFIASPGPHTYLDMKPHADFPLGLDWAGLVSARDAFDWSPEEELPVPADQIIGVEACLWTETVESFEHITTMLLPRLTGVASVAWGSSRNFDEYAQALPAHAAAWRAAGWSFYEAPEVNW